MKIQNLPVLTDNSKEDQWLSMIVRFWNDTDVGTRAWTGPIKILGSISFKSIIGVSDGSSAAVGSVGEWVASAVTAVNAATSTQYVDITSITLTAGDWDISALVVAVQNGASLFGIATVFLGQVSGNNTTGLAVGDNAASFIPPSATNPQASAAIPTWRLSIAFGATVYLKGTLTYTVATPQWYGRISARRVR